MAARLRPYAGQVYDVTAYWESKESEGFAEQLHQVLQLASWKFLPMEKWRGLLGGITGVFVGYHPQADERTKQAAAMLITALSLDGFQAEAQVENPTNNPKHNIIHLTIGSKR